MKLRITPVIATLVTLNLFKGIALLIVPHGLSAIKGSAAKPMPGVDQRLCAPGGAARPALGVLRRAPGDRHPRRRAEKDHPWQVRRGHRGQPHRGGALRHQRGQMGLAAVHRRGVLRRVGGHGARQLHVAGRPALGDGMELDCIIAVLLGGTAFSGGEGSVAKTIVGALIIMCVTTGLMTVIPAFWQTMAKGSVLIIAVVLNHLLVRDSAKA